jgi:hypothetical protein
MVATITRGVISTVTDTTNIKRDISEAIDFLSPFDTPFLDLVGRDSLSQACTQVKHEWMEDELPARSGTLAAAYTLGSGQLTLTSGEGKRVRPDDLILIDQIVFRILSGPPEADVCSVVVVGDSVDASIANGSTWRKIAHAAQEGGSARTDASKTTIVMPYNYTQILKDWCMVTGTMEVIDRYGYANERSYQEAKILKILAMDLEFELLYGVSSYDEGPPRKSTMGGLMHYLLLPGIAGSWDNVYNANSAALTESILNDVLQVIWQAGGNPDFMMVGGTNARRMRDWLLPPIRTASGDKTAGASIGAYQSQNYLLDVISNRHMRPSDVLIGTRGSMGIGPLSGRQFTSRELPTTADGTWYEILGEYTMEVHKPKIDWAWIYGTSTTY